VKGIIDRAKWLAGVVIFGLIIWYVLRSYLTQYSAPILAVPYVGDMWAIEWIFQNIFWVVLGIFILMALVIILVTVYKYSKSYR
jgi:hypothetical protein